MATVTLLADEHLSLEAAEVFAEIRSLRGTEHVNNFWRALAHDPATLRATWEHMKIVMAPGALDPLIKELIYVAVSTVNGCSYCIHSHTAAAKAKGMTQSQHGELMAVIAMAMQTNGMATALQVPVDEIFLAGQ
jgi:AhpD family alkylhydroperoxidase